MKLSHTSTKHVVYYAAKYLVLSLLSLFGLLWLFYRAARSKRR